MEHVNDIRPGPGRDGGRDSGLKIVGVDRLEPDFGAQRLAGLGDLAP